MSLPSPRLTDPPTTHQTPTPYNTTLNSATLQTPTQPVSPQGATHPLERPQGREQGPKPTPGGHQKKLPGGNMIIAAVPGAGVNPGGVISISQHIEHPSSLSLSLPPTFPRMLLPSHLTHSPSISPTCPGPSFLPPTLPGPPLPGSSLS